MRRDRGGEQLMPDDTQLLGYPQCEDVPAFATWCASVRTPYVLEAQESLYYAIEVAQAILDARFQLVCEDLKEQFLGEGEEAPT